jgi:methanogenic corrinoid protein MtbC1
MDSEIKIMIVDDNRDFCEILKEYFDGLEEAGLRDQVKIIVGGCPIDANVTKYTGADAYGKDAQEGVVIAKKWVNA